MPDSAVADPRLAALEAWAADHLGAPLTSAPASSDASFRRYFRITGATAGAVAMDAPPEHEDCRPFVDIAQRLAAAGVHVPTVLAMDLARGFLLLDDLGQQTYLDVINEANADRLLSAAIDALVQIQSHADCTGLPRYDDALLRRELGLFRDWYVERHLGLSFDAAATAAFEALCDRLIARALAGPRVFVHRDYMPRNLMVSDPNPGIIDFQDAVAGPVGYDPVCLLRDAFVSWPQARERAWLEQYWRRAGDAGVPVPESFSRFMGDCDLIGAQRHLKVIGIFARICHRDGKPHYLRDAPRFFRYLRDAAQRQPELADLGWLLHWLCQHGAECDA